MPGALIEALFITDPGDGTRAGDPSGQEVMAGGGLAKAIEQYLAPPPRSVAAASLARPRHPRSPHSEYSSGMIGTSLIALPQRGLFVAAKAVVLAAAAFVAGLISSVAAFFVGQEIMSSHHISTTLDHLGVLRAVIGGALCLTVGGLLAFGIGLLLRHTAAALATAVAVLFFLPIAGNLLPHSLQDHVDKWLPTAAGHRSGRSTPHRT